jgi:hypothetical protein
MFSYVPEENATKGNEKAYSNSWDGRASRTLWWSENKRHGCRFLEAEDKDDGVWMMVRKLGGTDYPSVVEF